MKQRGDDVGTKQQHRACSCCAFFSALLLEVLAWGLAVVAITTSFWLAPTAGALPAVSHAGLWRGCGASPAAPPPPPGDVLAAAAATVQTSIASVKRDVAYALYSTTSEGCGDARTAYADVNGGDYRLTLSVVRILALLFLALGFIKVLAALCGQCTRRVSGRRGAAACASASISLIQALTGWAAWGLFLQLLVRGSGAAGPAALWGWSFWIFSAALVAATLSGTAFCCA